MRTSPSAGAAQRRAFLAGHHRIGAHAIGDAACHRPDRVHALRQRIDGVARNAQAARLVADDAAQRRRHARRAAGVAADRDLAHAVGGGDRATRRRAAGNARAVGRIARRAVMRIGADAGEGEFGHVGLGDDHRAGLAQPPHHRRIGGGRLAFVGQHLRAGARDFAGDVEQILDGDDGAVERPERDAGLGARIGRLGGGARRVAIDGEAGARALALRIVDARQGFIEAFAGRARASSLLSPGCHRRDR